MSANTKIEWADHTFNPWIGCTKVSPACDHCYAEVSTPSRTLGVVWGSGQPRRRTTPGNWAMPKRWNAQADAFHAEHGRHQRVFCASLADVFDNEVPDEWRADLFDLIEATPRLDWLLLTKRVGNVPELLRRILRRELPANVWLGATICNQGEADRDIPKLLRVRATRHFLSMEPLLGQVNLMPWIGTADMASMKWLQDPRAPGAEIDWVIVGGESGPKARPMHPDWVRSLLDQCEAAGVPFMLKQWGEWSSEIPAGTVYTPPDLWMRADGRTAKKESEAALLGGTWVGVNRVGKHAAGRKFLGRTWDGSPT